MNFVENFLKKLKRKAIIEEIMNEEIITEKVTNKKE